MRHIGKLNGVVVARPDRLTEIGADLGRVNLEGRDKLEVRDVMPAETHVHQTRNLCIVGCAPIILNSLHERTHTVADTRDSHLYSHRIQSPHSPKRALGAQRTKDRVYPVPPFEILTLGSATLLG